MELIAQITIVVRDGKEDREVAPGERFTVEPGQEAKELIDRGFAVAVDSEASEAEAQAQAKRKAKG
jgi:hypothetical protein